MSKDLITIENLNAKLVKELQGWEEKQNELVKANPFVEIVDNKTYEEGKKRRTALVKGRTEIEKQDKLIASKIRQFRNDVKEASEQLILITLPFEAKQQDEVKRYEDIKAQEKAEKERKEQERKDSIKNKIDLLYNSWKREIEELRFDEIKNLEMEATLDKVDVSEFEEFELDFAEKRQLLTNLLAEKIEQLELAEAQRVEAERLKAEREALEAEKAKIRAEQEAKEQAQREAQAKIDAENKKKAQELARKEAEINAEKERIQKEKEEQERKEREVLEAKAEAKRKAEKLARMEALKPDVEKLRDTINSIGNDIKAPELKEEVSKEFFAHLLPKLAEFKENMLAELGAIK